MQAPDAYLRPALDKHLQPLRRIRVQPGRGGRCEALLKWGFVTHYTIHIIRNPHNSIGNYLSP